MLLRACYSARLLCPQALELEDQSATGVVSPRFTYKSHRSQPSLRVPPLIYLIILHSLANFSYTD